MGYTRYWNRTEKPITDYFIEFCNEVFAQCEKMNIKICNWDGTNEPTVTKAIVSFNGCADYGHDHESCVIGSETGFNFCKTARKPYDYAVRTILREALTEGLITDLSDDGINEEIISDSDY